MYVDFDKNYVLYTGNKSLILYTKISKEIFKAEDKIADVKQLKVKTIETDLTIHGFLRDSEDFMVIFEREDNQLDFNKLKVMDIDNEDRHNYEFVQQIEALPRPISHDPVVKVVHYSDAYLVALRKSGKFDIYWRLRRINSPEDSK